MPNSESINSEYEEFGDNAVEKMLRGKTLQREPVEVVQAENGERIASRTWSFCQWQVGPNNTFTPGSSTTSSLPSGFYSVRYNDGRIIFDQKEVKTDEFLYFEDSQLSHVLDEIRIFWGKKKVFQKYGFLHRRGILLYGPAGGGKTVLIQQAVNELIHNKGLVLYVDENPHLIGRALNELRMIEPERNTICIFEDIDAYISTYSEEAVLSLLDGENMTDNVLNIATTNYPERLDRRIIARPRRFDRVIKIGMPTASMRSLYFQTKLKIEGEELNNYVIQTEGFSFAAMTELVISVKCFDRKFEDAVDILKKMMSVQKKYDSGEYYENRTGFSA